MAAACRNALGVSTATQHMQSINTKWLQPRIILLTGLLVHV